MLWVSISKFGQSLYRGVIITCYFLFPGGMTNQVTGLNGFESNYVMRSDLSKTCP